MLSRYSYREQHAIVFSVCFAAVCASRWEGAAALERQEWVAAICRVIASPNPDTGAKD